MAIPSGRRADEGSIAIGKCRGGETTAGGDNENQQVRNCGRSLTFLGSAQKLWRPVFQANLTGEEEQNKDKAHLLI